MLFMGVFQRSMPQNQARGVPIITITRSDGLTLKGNVGKAAMTLEEFEAWLHIEVCRYHNKRHNGLGRSPIAAWSDLGGDNAGRRAVDKEAFKISFLPSEYRQLSRTGIKLFSVVIGGMLLANYWTRRR